MRVDGPLDRGAKVLVVRVLTILNETLSLT